MNTTEVDIKKSSRMKNPHKTRKVGHASDATVLRCGRGSAHVAKCYYIVFVSCFFLFFFLTAVSVGVRAAERHPHPQSNPHPRPRSQTAHRRRTAGTGRLTERASLLNLEPMDHLMIDATNPKVLRLAFATCIIY